MGSLRSDREAQGAGRERPGATAGAGEGQLSIRAVGKIYDPDGAHVVALDECSLEIAPGGQGKIFKNLLTTISSMI